jgi:hypothetical protein
MNKFYYLEKKLQRFLECLFGIFFFLTGLGSIVVGFVLYFTGVFLIDYLIMFVVLGACVFITLVGLLVILMCFEGDRHE